MFLELPVQYKHIAELIQDVFVIASGEGFTVPEYQIQVSDLALINLNLPDNHYELYPDGPDQENIYHSVSDSAEVIVLRYLDHPVCDEGSDDYRFSDHSKPARHAVMIDVFSQALPGKISEQWYSHQINLAGSLISRIEVLQSPDEFKNYHLSWFLVLLMLDFPLVDALILARAAMNVSRETWPKEVHLFPKIDAIDLSSSFFIPETPFPSINQSLLNLYPVMGDSEWIKKLLELGVKTIQLRIKDEHRSDLIKQIREVVSLGQASDSQVFINDYWKIAIDENAFGIHLGQEDLLAADLKSIHAAGLRLGVSTHSYQEILTAELIKPSYIALGHIFPTSTKQMPSKPQGLVRLRLYQQFINSLSDYEKRMIPTVAIGGIDLTNLSNVAAQGVDSIAVVRAITDADDYVDAVTKIQTDFNLSKRVNHVEI
ncbi:Thiamine-phosphate synthase [Vibrio quintilis]|uniref:Thiamine-phosphate synthase n=2 Tax=Vibrio quintilis TaxID=1117707 RepID=A0A1M7YUH0_9VIBR|nr:Thiamine-phosphate synthase [Vibrio quintilis]